MQGLHNFMTSNPCGYCGSFEKDRSSFEKGVSIKTQGLLVTKLCDPCVAGDPCYHMETRLNIMYTGIYLVVLTSNALQTID